jgi:hypothetical protein
MQFVKDLLVGPTQVEMEGKDIIILWVILLVYNAAALKSDHHRVIGPSGAGKSRVRLNESAMLKSEIDSISM